MTLKPKFEIGDRVRVLSPKDDESIRILGWHPQMDLWVGLETAIESHRTHGLPIYNSYHLEGENHPGLLSGWIWHEDWLELVAQPIDVWTEELVLNYE